MKKCTKCKVDRDLSMFGSNKKSKDGKQSWCRVCHNKLLRERWAEDKKYRSIKMKRSVKRYALDEQFRNKQKETSRGRTPEYRRAVQLKTKYGITPEDEAKMIEAQGGKCSICGRGPRGKGRQNSRLHIDHDHKTGRVRSLLCRSCNLAVGLLDEKWEYAAKMAEYLRRYVEIL